MAEMQLDEKAQRILSVAFELAEEGGFEAVRLRDVAQRADVALGTLYNRFSSKEEMLVTALDESTKTFESVVSALDIADGEPADRVAELLVLTARALFNRPNFGRCKSKCRATRRSPREYPRCAAAHPLEDPRSKFPRSRYPSLGTAC